MTQLTSVGFFWAGLAFGTAPLEQPFSLRAEVVEALEGGPVVVRVSYSYTGVRPIDVSWSAPHNASWGFEGSNGWVRRAESGRPKPFIKAIRVPYTFDPGETVAEYFFLHHHWMIPPGKATLVFVWSVKPPAPPGGPAREQALARTETTIEVNVLPATFANVAAVRASLLREAVGPKKSSGRAAYEARRVAYEAISGCEHSFFFSLALTLLESDPIGLNARATDYMAGCVPRGEVIEKWLSYLETNKNPRAMQAIFDTSR